MPDRGRVMENTTEIHTIIKEILSRRQPELIDDPGGSYLHAGVLIPLFKKDGEYRVIFTKRSSMVAHHKGQISFPGGAVDPEDHSPVETALREAYEEIGLRKDDVEILGRIDDTLTLVSSFLVHPVVGLVPYPYRFALSEQEVERLIIVPLRVFHPSYAKPSAGVVDYEGITYRSIVYEYNGDVIWGATARIMQNFMDIVGDKLPLPEGGG